MAVKRVQKKIAWTEADRERHRKLRERFQDRPTAEELAGEYGPPAPLGTLLDMLATVAVLKKARQKARLTLSDVSRASGIQTATLSKLENGRITNPTVDTLARFAAAVGKRLTIVFRPASSSSRRKAGHAG